MDVVCLGEVLVDMFPAEIGKPLAQVTAFKPKPGGAPANVAVGLARLGKESAFIGKVGDDPFGHHLAQTLSNEGVEVRGLRFDPEARTTLAFIAQPDPHRAEFLFYRNPGADTRLREDELDERLLASTRFLHFGSLSLAEEPIRSTLLKAIPIVHSSGGKVSFDVNYRPTLWSSQEKALEQIEAVLSDVYLLKVNKFESRLLTGFDDPERGSEKLLTFGPQIVVVTAGDAGSYFCISGYGYFVPSFPVETVDSTGCGDAFVSGLLSRLTPDIFQTSRIDPEEMKRNLIYANAVGAVTAQVQGVIPALPTAQMVDAFLSQQPRWND